MIKTKNGQTTLEGSVVTLLADATSVLNAVYESIVEHGMSEEEAKEGLQNSLEMALIPKGEIKKRLEDELKAKGDVLHLIDLLFEDDDEIKEEYFRVWCETNEERDKVLEIVENRGIRWRSLDKPTAWEGIGDAPLGLIVENFLTKCDEDEKEHFQALQHRLVTVEDLIKEEEENE